MCNCVHAFDVRDRIPARAADRTSGVSSTPISLRGTPSGGGRSTFLEFARPEIGEEEIEAVVEVLRSGWITGGPRVAEFEARLAERLEGAHVRCTSSATGALLIALRLVGVGPGSEVVLPTLTFAACANVVELLGAVPVLADVDPATGLIDLDCAERLIGTRTRALLAVHLGGRPLDLDRLGELADRHGVAVIEDAAHAIGAAWNGRPIGTHGNPCAFSFHASKNMTTVEGGALVLPDESGAVRAERMRLHGLTRSAWDRHASAGPAEYELDEPGFKLTMNDVSAAIGVLQLAKLDAWIERRAELSASYGELLAELPLELEPPIEPGARHAHHIYAVRVAADAPVDRDTLIRALLDAQIGTSVHFKPLHRFRYYRDRYDLDDSAFPAASDFADRTLSLPLYPSLTAADQLDVVRALHGALR
jgi:dTDP-4-amino-4,6-dideoxygalactose transaminase